MMEKFSPVLAVALPAYLYLLGYAYVNAYYNFFSIDVREISVGFEEIVVNAAPVIIALVHKWEVSFPVAFLVLCYLLGSGSLFFQYSRIGILASLAAILVVIFFDANRLGELKAQSDLFDFAIVELPAESSGDNESLDFAQRLLDERESELRHLTSSETHHYLIVTYSDAAVFYTIRVQRDALPWLFVMQDI